MTVKVGRFAREMELRTEPYSIFDVDVAGQHDSNGNYVIVMVRENGDRYAIPRDDWFRFKAKGKALDEGEVQTVAGETSRGMTEYEERQWNIGTYDGLYVVDLWGNIKVEQESTLHM